MSLPLHADTEKLLAAHAHTLPHGIIISGPKGVGVRVAAQNLAEKSLVSVVEPLTTKGEIDHETGTISIEVIRKLYEQTRAKASKRRVYIIHGADRLSLGAQAAFLKLLEEPTEHTHFILTSHSPQMLLPTIRSRVQSVPMRRITPIQTNEYIESFGISDARVKTQLSFLASGLPEELTRLINDQDYFSERAKTMSDTRVFLTGSTYEKLILVHAYHQSKVKALQLVAAAITATKHGLHAHPQPNHVVTLERLVRIEDNIAANCNVRLQLTAFVVQ